MDVCSVGSGIKGWQRGTTQTIALSCFLPAIQGVQFISSRQPQCLPKHIHVTRIWHNRPTSFVSWAYSDTVHRDLSLDNTCRYKELSFLVGVLLKGAQSFQRTAWHRLTLYFSLIGNEFVCVHRKLFRFQGMCRMTSVCSKHAFTSQKTAITRV